MKRILKEKTPASPVRLFISPKSQHTPIGFQNLSIVMLITCVPRDPVADMGKLLKKHRLIPDVLPCAPRGIISALYPCDIQVEPGLLIKPDEVRKPPILRWQAEPYKYYTFMMIDLDFPSRADHSSRSWQNWLVGNVPGCDVINGQELTAYVGSRPDMGTGMHRYLFVAYKQICELDFDESYIPFDSTETRGGFSINRFAKKYALGNPVAANFFMSEWNLTCDYAVFEHMTKHSISLRSFSKLNSSDSHSERR
ncbi:putative odorant-binding protein A5 [Scaptodrosophila lebanonensis]|uniref:Odorant-binding protein A5 n=1 Tax=Drosophila lebanonensis TaxID=7225 RepID=A0A6J2UDI7_DROLE|nr:putative odorant-binding protein A5 [Scaptodrosophila lebanonensis]